MMLKLVAPEYRHKAWNNYGLFTNYLEQRGVKLTLFSYKDHRLVNYKYYTDNSPNIIYIIGLDA